MQLGLERGDLRRADQRVVDTRDRILPEQLFCGHLWAEVARAWPHVAVGELEPGARESVRELFGICQEAARDPLVRRVEAQRQIRGEHGRNELLRSVVGVRDGGLGALGDPLLGARGALAQLPFEREQILEEMVAPLGRSLTPGDLEAARDRVRAFAAAKGARPAQAQLCDVGRFGVEPDVLRVTRAMSLAEAVTTGDQRHRFFVVHCHAREGLADVFGRGDRIRIAVRPLWVDVNQTHLHRSQRIFELALARIALVREPGGFGAPIHVLIRFPDIGATATETEGLEAHGFERHVAGEDQQIGPGNLLPILLLDRPKQAPRLVQAHVVRPAIQRREALLASAAATAAVTDAVGAGAVPGHAHEEPPVVTEVRRPILLRVGHQRRQVELQGRKIQARERLSVVEARAHRIGLGRMLMQQIYPQLVRPPITVGCPTSAVIERTLRLGCHRVLLAREITSTRSTWEMSHGCQTGCATDVTLPPCAGYSCFGREAVAHGTHILRQSGSRSPMSTLDHEGFLQQQPSSAICEIDWWFWVATSTRERSVLVWSMPLQSIAVVVLVDRFRATLLA